MTSSAEPDPTLPPPLPTSPEPGAPPLSDAAPETDALRLPTASPIVTFSLIGLTLLIYLVQRLTPDHQILYGYAYDLPAAWGAKFNDLIRAGQLWRFFTPMLLHGSAMHIGVNLYTIFSFGLGLERRFGHWRLALLCLLSGFAGNVLSFVISPAPSVGSSAIVFGLIAAEGVFLYENRKLFGSETKLAITNVIVVITLYLAAGFSSPGYIDNWEHVGGLLGGAIFTWFSGPLWTVEGKPPLEMLVDHRPARDVVFGAGFTLLIFAILASVGMIL